MCAVAWGLWIVLMVVQVFALVGVSKARRWGLFASVVVSGWVTGFHTTALTRSRRVFVVEQK